jgi:hypothetical protein
MPEFGLAVPPGAFPSNPSPMPAPLGALAPGVGPQNMSLGGIMQAKPLSQLLEEERKASLDRATEANNQAVVISLASQVRRHWEQAKIAKLDIEREMVTAMRAKRGEYSPEMKSQLTQQGSSLIYMMLFATKARQAKALLGDVLLGAKDDKPWSLSPTPDPQIPEDIKTAILTAAMGVVAEAEMSGLPMTQEEVRVGLREVKDQITAAIVEEARVRADRASVKVEDMLAEGGFIDALDAFLDDLPVYKTCFLKGPIMRKTGTLKWVQQEDGTSTPEVTEEVKPHYERVDPLNIYPAPWSRTVQDGYLIERHKLSPAAISDLIGVEGYNEDALRQVMDQYGKGGLREWLQVDSDRATAEQRNYTTTTTESDLIDALQYWGEIPGKLLVEWGMGEDEIPDEAKVYNAEVWLIGTWVIKAALNVDPLARRPYYASSYEMLPGAFWGNSVYDTMRDCEDMCNAAARSLANNMGIASGPQVWVNTDRLPSGENITTLFPWKIWQTTSDPMGGTAPPVGFFQPTSNAQELMAVFDKFSVLADEVTGIPRYMAGIAGGSGEVGRTASGMSMMIGNANKTIKKTVQSIDMKVIAPAVSAAYEHLMRYSGDPDIKGDLQVVARGATSLVAKDAAAVRRSEFLTATNNPTDLQIIGAEGRAELLREAAKNLDMNTDRIVPPASVIKQRLKAQAQAAAVAAAEQAEIDASQQPAPGGGRKLQNGAPVQESFQNT